jgi:hypothetical protein
MAWEPLQETQDISGRSDEVIFLYLSDHQVRNVRIDVPHSEHPTPTWQGRSVGYYVGDTLVIDTVGQKVDRSLWSSGSARRSAVHCTCSSAIGSSTAHWRATHESTYLGAGRSSPYTNEYGRGDTDPDMTKPGLQVEITVDDPTTFTTAWSGLVTYRRVLGEWPEAVCAENTRGSGTSWVTLVPQAENPDF